MAEYYAKHPLPYTLIFLAFGAEEAGLHGSMHYTAREPLFPLAQTKFVLNYDLMGNGQEGVMTVAGKTFAPAFEALQRLNEERKLIQPLASRPNAPNSDHYPFTLKDVPAFFFYTQGGSKAYHDIDDLPANLSFPAINRMFVLTDLFMRQYLMR
jgi:Zn-dependent M28 family amino/carboxypeptidase